MINLNQTQENSMLPRIAIFLIGESTVHVAWSTIQEVAASRHMEIFKRVWRSHVTLLTVVNRHQRQLPVSDAGRDSSRMRGNVTTDESQ